MQMKKVYCIGELLIDFVAENQGKDLTQAVQFTKKAGGAPANVACAISKLGGSAVFVGAVGQDAFGQFLLDTLMAHGVDVSTAQRSQTFTTLAFVSIASDGERDFVFSRGADQTLSYQSSLGKQLQDSMVHFGAATSFLGGPLEDAYGRYLIDAQAGDCTFVSTPTFAQTCGKITKLNTCRNVFHLSRPLTCVNSVMRKHCCCPAKKSCQQHVPTYISWDAR